MSETSNNNENKKVVIELDNVRRDFLVGDETVHALKGASVLMVLIPIAAQKCEEKGFMTG